MKVYRTHMASDQRTAYNANEDTEPAYITLTEATRVLPRHEGKKIHVRTVKKWVTTGMRNGVRLVGVKIGGRWFTTLEWIENFKVEMTRKAGVQLIDPKAAEKRDARNLRELQRRYKFNVTRVS